MNILLVAAAMAILSALAFVFFQYFARNREVKFSYPWLPAEMTLHEVLKDKKPVDIDIDSSRFLSDVFSQKISRSEFGKHKNSVDFIFYSKDKKPLLYVFIIPYSPWGPFHKECMEFISLLEKEGVTFIMVPKSVTYSIGRAEHLIEEVKCLLAQEASIEANKEHSDPI